jgi:hypothetical protein
MVSRSPFTPLVTKLERPVAVEPDLCFALPTTIEADAVSRLLEAECLQGVTRPADLRDAGYFEAPTLVHLPVWRTDVHAEGFHIGLSTVSIPSARSRTIPLPIPTGGTDNRDLVVVSAARRFFSLDVAGMLLVPQEKLVPVAHAALAGTVAEPDVPRSQAEAEAVQRVRAALRPTNAIYASAEATVRSTALVYVPLWVQRYRYDGEAVPGLAEDFHTVIEGTWGRVVSARHPSGFRSVVGKVKRLFARR